MTTTKTRPTELYDTVKKVLLNNTVSVYIGHGEDSFSLSGQISMYDEVGFILMYVKIDGHTLGDGPRTSFIPWSSAREIGIYSEYTPIPSK